MSSNGNQYGAAMTREQIEKMRRAGFEWLKGIKCDNIEQSIDLGLAKAALVVVEGGLTVPPSCEEAHSRLRDVMEVIKARGHMTGAEHGVFRECRPPPPPRALYGNKSIG